MPDYAGGNGLGLLRNGEQYFPALVEAIDAARAEVFLESYIYASDETGSLIADALVANADLLGWHASVHPSLPAGLTPGAADCVVVLEHDLAVSGSALAAALAAGAGYVGALGSRRTQAARAGWLAASGWRACCRRFTRVTASMLSSPINGSNPARLCNCRPSIPIPVFCAL